MVRVEKITLQGFKSFAGRTAIPLGAGFSALCGPNGSGKSNVTDGFCFVLGKLSAKSLRADKFKSLLFNGAVGSKPADFASVSLYFQNQDGGFPIDDKEVVVTRKINKRGISVYKLNGRTVTRQRIIDLLSQARLSPDAFNVIMQGDVTRVIEMNPVQRRQIIDEMSGIAEFDDKKDKAEKELAKVEAKVGESQIVVNEKKTFLDRLEKEKKTAETFRRLSGDLQIFRASLYKKKLIDSETILKDMDKQIKENGKLVSKLDKEIETFDKEIETKEKQIRTMGSEAIKKAKSADLIRKIEKLRGELQRKRERIESNKTHIERLEGMIARLETMRGSDLGFSHAVRAVLDLKKRGVYSVISNLISVPSEYQEAVEVALGMHIQDVVVDSDETARDAINYLKNNKIGRTRFLPLNKIKYFDRRPQIEALSRRPGVAGFVLDLVDFDPKYESAFKYVFSDTLVVENLKVAREIGIGKVKMVTLEGDLCERSGAMVGGFRVKKSRIKLRDENTEMKGYIQESASLEKENESLEKEVEQLEEELEKFSGEEATDVRDIIHLENERTKSEKDIDKLKANRKRFFEQKILEEDRLNKLNLKRERADTEKDTNKLSFEDYKGMKTVDKGMDELNSLINETQRGLNELGPVNMKAIEEYDILKKDYSSLVRKLEKLVEERYSILKIIVDIESKRKDAFMKTFGMIAGNFTKIYRDLVGGDGYIELEEPENIESGLVIKGCPAGKKFLTLDALSGGEKTLTALAFLFSLQQFKPAPFYILDEVDAALDKRNTKKIGDLIRNYSGQAQFIVITHNDATISMADRVYGVSMDRGISKIVGISMPQN